MRSIWRAVVGLAVAGTLHGAAIAQQTTSPPDPGTTLEDIVVSGRTREASADFVAGLTLADVPDRQIARFDFRICPGVIGLRRAAAQAMNDRLAQISYDLGLRVEGASTSRLEDMSLEEVEAFLIKKAMARYGNVSQAARALGLSRSALYRRLERYKL